MTIDFFDGLHDVFDIHDIYGSNSWTWNSSGTSSLWEVTAYDGATLMATFTINGTHLDDPGAILI
jgi:hypothetical protein